MTDERLQAAYARVLAAREPGDRTACATPEQIQALVERRGPETERLRTLDHAMSCPACRREFELLRAVQHAGQARQARRPRVWLIAASVAIAAALVVLANPRGPLAPDDIARGGGDVVGLVSPRGELTAGAAPLLVWRAYPLARRYDVEVLDTLGNVVHQQTTSDTTLVLPATVRLEPGTEYRWWVRGPLVTGGQFTSTPERFRIRTP